MNRKQQAEKKANQSQSPPTRSEADKKAAQPRGQDNLHKQKGGQNSQRNSYKRDEKR